MTAKQAAEPGEGSVFRGLDVAETAGLRLRPGSPRAMFGQEVWDLSGLIDAPVVMGAFRKTLDFTVIADPCWRWVAREYLLARLAPRLPAIATLPHAFRTPLNPQSLWTELNCLTRWFNHLTDAGVTSLADVDQHHCDTYLHSVSHSKIDAGRALMPATIALFVRRAQVLTCYSEILSDKYRPGFRPWADRSADDVAGYVRSKFNTVLPVPDTTLRPLLANAVYLLDIVGPHLANEVAAVRASDRHEAASVRALKVAEIERLREAVDARRVAGIPAPRLDVDALSKRVKGGWDPGDPLLHMAWHPVVVESVGAMGHRRDLEAMRPELERWVAACGIQERWGRDAAEVPRCDTGNQVPWTLPIHRHELGSAVYVLTSAAYYLTSALSGMRSSELAELTAGCRREESRPGGSRFHLVTRRIKGEAFGGVQDAWVVIEDVYRAIGMTEILTAASPGDLLFAIASNNSHRRYTALRNWTNGESGRRLGLASLPPDPVNPRALRRTLALTIAQRPHGLMAAKQQLKHISVVTTEGYAARPGGHQAAFLAEVSAAEESEHLRLTVAAYEDYIKGILPSGKGARELVEAFESVDRLGDRHDPGPVTVIDDRRVERILKATATTLHVGVANYCWFTNPRRALCLQLAGTPDADEPLLGMCDSARCPQATHHPQHRQVWAEHATQTQAVFLGNPRLSKPERARAKATYERATRIVAEIDTASGAGAEEIADGN